MKRNYRHVTAFVLTLLLIATSSIPAFAATDASASIDGSSTVESVTLNVILPTSISFALDPLGLKVIGGNQISKQDFFFVNQTFAPVKVSLDITAKTSGGAVLVATTGGLKKDDTTVTTKQLYFGALGATGLTGASIDTTTAGITYSAIFGTTTGPAAEYATVSAVAATQVPFTPNTAGTSGSAVIAFALDKAVESTTTPGNIESLATGNKGIAAFQFYGELNTYADWKANDVTVTGTYTLTPLRTTTYDGYTPISGSLNQIVVAAATPEPETPTYTTAGFIVNGATHTTCDAITFTSGSATNIVIPFYANSLSVTSLTSSTYTVPTTNYAISVADNTFTIYATSAGCWINSAGTGTKSMTLTLSNSSAFTFSIIKQ